MQDGAVERALELAAHPFGQLLLELVPFKGDKLAKFARDYRNLRLEQGQRKLGEAKNWVEGVVDDLGDVDVPRRIAEEPLLADLFERALEAVLSARDERQVAALRHAVTSGVLATDTASVDDELFVVETVSRLKPPHLRVLHLLGQDLRVRKARVTTLHWTTKATRPTTELLVAQLVAAGVIEEVTVPSPARSRGPERGVQITDYGRKVCRYLGIQTDHSDPVDDGDEAP